MKTCPKCGVEATDVCTRCCLCDVPLVSSESDGAAGVREATVSGPTHGSPERERCEPAGPESQQPCSPAEPGGEREAAAQIVAAIAEHHRHIEAIASICIGTTNTAQLEAYQRLRELVGLLSAAASAQANKMLSGPEPAP